MKSLKAFFTNLVSRKANVIPSMTEDEKMVIGLLALLDAKETSASHESRITLSQQAIVIYEKYLPTIGVRGSLEMKYLSEIFNSVPDPILRAIYREELVAFAQKRVNVLVGNL